MEISSEYLKVLGKLENVWEHNDYWRRTFDSH